MSYLTLEPISFHSLTLFFVAILVSYFFLQRDMSLGLSKVLPSWHKDLNPPNLWHKDSRK